jgi:hypothetical protein
MREEKMVVRLLDPVPGTTADLEMQNLIATKRDERESWSKIREEIEGYCPRIIDQPPFNGRIVLFPGCSYECPEFRVVTPQGFRLMFRPPGAVPEESKYGLTFDWGPAGKGHRAYMIWVDDEEYVLTLLSVDRKRSLVLKTWQESVKNELLKALPASQSSCSGRRRTEKLSRRVDRAVWCSETLSIQANDPGAVVEALTRYRSYLDDMNAPTCRDLVEAVHLRARPVGRSL